MGTPLTGNVYQPPQTGSEQIRQPLPEADPYTYQVRETYEWWALPGADRRKKGQFPVWCWLIPPMWIILVPIYLLYGVAMVALFVFIVLPVNLVRLATGRGRVTG